MDPEWGLNGQKNSKISVMFLQKIIKLPKVSRKHRQNTGKPLRYVFLGPVTSTLSTNAWQHLTIIRAFESETLPTPSNL
jgi:hypothetical protein